MFQPKPATRQGLLFAPRSPIQRGEGFFGAIASLFRKAAPFIKKAASSTGNVLKKVAKSEVVDSITKGVGNAALDIGSNYVADLVSGKTGVEASSAANQKLDQARVDIANMMRNPDFSKSVKKRKRKKGKSKSKRKLQNEDKREMEDDDDESVDGDDDDDDEEEPASPRKKSKKKTIVKTKQKKKNRRKNRKEAYSLFDEDLE